MARCIVELIDDPIFYCRYVWNKNFIGDPIQSRVWVENHSGRESCSIEMRILQISIAYLRDQLIVALKVRHFC